MIDVFHWVAQHGYSALFVLLVAGIVGVPVPDEALLTYAGYLAFKGNFRLLPTIVAGFLGSACGISLSYLLGRSAGLFVIHKLGRYLHVDEAKLDRVRGWFHRFGKWTLIVGYYLPGVRHLTAVVAGTAKLAFPEFALFAYAGASLWSVTFITLGYTVGREWKSLVLAVQTHLMVVTGALAVVAVLYWLVRYLRARRV